MTRVAYQPCSDKDSQRNLIKTIHKPVPIDYLSYFLDAEAIKRLRNLYPSGEAHIWGVSINQNTRNSYRDLAAGDIAIFNIKTLMSITGVVTHKLLNAKLAANLWGWKDEKAGVTWEGIYFLDQVSRISVPYDVAFENSSKKPRIPFTLLSQRDSEQILESINIEDVIPGALPVPSLEETQEEIRKGSPDGRTETPTRKEHHFIVNHLFGNRTAAECCICGKTYPRAYLVAAHIKKRSRCETKEKLDVQNIALPMCVFGCDKLFENGVISVDAQGIVIGKRVGDQHQPIKTYVNQVLGTKCTALNRKNDKYFRWHRMEHGFEEIG